MNFEQESNQYLVELISGGTILSGDLIGVSEGQFVAKAIASFLISGQVKEKIIMIKKTNDVLSWYFVSPVDVNDINKTEDNWSYPNFAKRIIAPVSLIMDPIGVQMFGWFQLNSLPTVTVDTSVYLYCNVILPEHQAIIDSLQGVITVEDRP